MATEPALAKQTTESAEKMETSLTKSFLNLEKIDVDLYRSRHLWKPSGGRAVFGGQVVGQALAAAAFSVPSDHHTHSLHCYFLRPGDAKTPILYTVDRTRDGNVYSSRSIKAMQGGRPIFTMQASFKTAETDSFSHQFTMPSVPPPQHCMDTQTLRAKLLKCPDNAQDVTHRMLNEKTVILQRHIDSSYFSSQPMPARRALWLKVAENLGDDHKIHQCCAAYMSDFMLMGIAFYPYHAGPVGARGKFFVTSIDHAVWFHSELRADDWLLFEMESSVCGEGRAYLTGRMWTQDGRLVISVAQEGVVRTRTPRIPDALPEKSKL